MDIGELFRQMAVAGVRSVVVSAELHDRLVDYAKREELPALCSLYGVAFELEPDRSGWPVVACPTGCGFSGVPEETYNHLAECMGQRKEPPGHE